MPELVTLDGAHGEGGGQILRTALALSAWSGRPVRIEQIRAGRDQPGLRPQHLAAVRACAQVCAAQLEGDAIGSDTLIFAPQCTPQPGDYVLDIGQLSGEGSAGATTLLFQTLLVPLSLTEGDSTLRLRGGTHVRWSPPYHYLAEVFSPLAERCGLRMRFELAQWGWYPRGGGEMIAHIEGLGEDPAALSPLQLTQRGKLTEVWGISAASNLPEHITERQAAQAIKRLRARHLRGEIELIAAPSPGSGTVLFVVAQYEHVAAGFTGYGKLRYPAEEVANDALNAFEAHLSAKAALDPYLADQMILPLVLAPGPSRFTTSEVTGHLQTVCWVVQQFVERSIEIEGAEGQPGTVTIR
jgi:RNA 3'-terminal phosphate cyclase (ATP)